MLELKLKKAIDTYPQSMSTRSQLAGLLRDLFPLDKRFINIVLIVYDSSIITKISGLKIINQAQMHNFSKQLVDEFGLQEKYAIEGITAWAAVYGIPIETSESEYKPQQSVTSQHSTAPNPDTYAKAGVIVDGKNIDYEIITTKDGIIISKFRGFDEADVVVPNAIDGKKVIGIGEEAYIKCSCMKTLVVSDGIEFIEDGAFAKCDNLTKVTLPETLKRIGSIVKSSNNFLGAFQYCPIQSIELPTQVTYLGASTFSNCERLLSIDLPNGIRGIQRNTFYGCSGLSKINFPDCLIEIGYAAFRKCSSLKTISFPASLKEIDDSAFSDCSSLEDIKFPTSLHEIGKSAFSCCTSLTEVILNEGLTVIGAEAFADCSSLRSFLLPRTVDTIEKSYLGDVFTSSIWNKNDNLMIYCYAGSYGLEYAREKGYPIQNAANFPL